MIKYSITGKATLYVIVDQTAVQKKNLDEIKNDTGHQAASPDLTESGELRRRVIYSIAQIIPFIKNKDVLRYIPDDMLSEAQKKTKWEGIAETVKKTNEKNNKKYVKYISEGNLFAARQMVISVAKAAGYTNNSSYQGSLAFKVKNIITLDR